MALDAFVIDLGTIKHQLYSMVQSKTVPIALAGFIA